MTRKALAAQMELTDKDMCLLRCLGHYGNMYSVDSKYIYGSASYGLKRLSRLSKANYINRGGGYVRLGVEGRKVLEVEGSVINRPNYRDQLKLRSAMMCRLSMVVKGWRFEDSTSMARQQKGSGYYQMLGKLKNGSGKEVAVYYIRDKASKTEQTMISKEVRQLGEQGIEEILYILESEACLEILSVYDLPITPHRHCYIFNKEGEYVKWSSLNKVERESEGLRLLGERVGQEVKRESGSGYDGYLILHDKKYMVLDLLLPDLKKEQDLGGRIMVLQNRISSSYIPTTVVCYELMSEYYKQKYPSENICIIPDPNGSD